MCLEYIVLTQDDIQKTCKKYSKSSWLFKITNLFHADIYKITWDISDQYKIFYNIIKYRTISVSCAYLHVTVHSFSCLDWSTLLKKLVLKLLVSEIFEYNLELSSDP
jgi:hypothetical protein